MRTLLIALATLAIATPSSAIKLVDLVKSTPNVVVYRQSETTALVYDARPELALDTSSMDKTARDAIIRQRSVRVLRQTLDWSKMEPEKQGLYDSVYLKEWDDLVSQCRAEGACLCVAVTGHPSGMDLGNSKAFQDRLAAFMADMAGRYPSISYWELSYTFTHFDSTATPDAKAFAAILKAASPAIRTGNPSAHVVAELGIEQAVARAVYESGAKTAFDIASVRATTPDTFSDAAKAARKLMSEYGDETKPLWCEVDLGEQDPDKTLQGLFDANNSQHLCDKILTATAGPIATWLAANSPNARILARPRNAVDVLIPTKAPMIPVGYSYRQLDGGVEVHGVVVDSLVPTLIQLMFAPEPPPAKPGVKPLPKRNGAPQPDPWDI